jgi:hypothetical protein
VRSVFTREQRFEQTKITIESIRSKIPNAFICIVECSPLQENEHNYLCENSNILINLYDCHDIREQHVYSRLKGMGERMMTIEGIKRLFTNLTFTMQVLPTCKSFFKITGRYFLNDHFDHSFWTSNNNNIIRLKDNNANSFFYKMPVEDLYLWLRELEKGDTVYRLKSLNQSFELILYDYLISKKGVTLIEEGQGERETEKGKCIGITCINAVSGTIWNF